MAKGDIDYITRQIRIISKRARKKMGRNDLFGALREMPASSQMKELNEANREMASLHKTLTRRAVINGPVLKGRGKEWTPERREGK